MEVVATSTVTRTSQKSTPQKTLLDVKRRPIDGPARPEEFIRVPPMTIRLTCDGVILKQQVDDCGILLANPEFNPSEGAAAVWTRSRSLKKLSVPALDEGTAVALVGNEQRVVLKQLNTGTSAGSTSNNKAPPGRILLDLYKSPERDLLVISRPETSLLVLNEVTGESCMIKLELVRTTSERTSTKNRPEDAEDILGENDTSLGTTIVTKTTLMVWVNNTVMATLDDNTRGVKISDNELPLPMALGGSTIGGFQLDGERACIFTPKSSSLPSAIAMFLVIPDVVEWPLCRGDRLILDANGRRDVCEVQVDAGPFLKSAATALTTTEADPAQTMPAVALEVPMRSLMKDQTNAVGQEGPNSSDQAIRSLTAEYLLFTPQNDSFSIGRRSSDVCLPDPHLSKYHAEISRVGNDRFLVSAQGNRPIFLLLGKQEHHYRPPLPLEPGDVITAGKCDFKVMCVRGAKPGWMISTSVEDELKARMCRASGELETIPGLEKDARLISEAAEDQLFPEDFAIDPDDLFRKFSFPAFCNPLAPLLVLGGVRGAAAGKIFVCNPLETIIGSSPLCSIHIPSDERMSATHSRIFFNAQSQSWMVQDLCSRHGTFLRLIGEQSLMLAIGDILVMGQTNFRVLGQLLRTLQARTEQSSGNALCCSIS